MAASARPARPIRLGMVGGGSGAFIGGVHRIAARLDGHYDLVAGALSSDKDRALASAQEIGIAPDRAYGDFRRMAESEASRDDGIDVVSIVTPNSSHHAIARAFLDNGIHVICEKPLTTTVAEADDLVAAVGTSGLVFGVTHTYTGYPMVRQMRDMVAGGALGRIRVVQVDYAQDWLALPEERDGNKQAGWRTDPAVAGAGCLGDIGSHAFNLAGFVTGLAATELLAQVSTFVEGRRVDDDAQMLLRFEGGARGMLWASQVAAGNENALTLRVYGDKAGLSWAQEHPNHLSFTPLGEAPRLVTRGGPGAGAAANHASRVPGGHPEGYLEAFAQLYTDLAEQVRARIEGREPDPASLLVPDVHHGAESMRFIAAALRSSEQGGSWVGLDATS